MAWWQFWLPSDQRKSLSSLELFRDLFGSRQSKSGQTVNTRTALETSVVLAAARVIAEGLAQVPCKTFQRMENGNRIEARDHPLYELLQLQPNEWQTSFEFLEQIGFHVVLCGNAYIFKNVVSGRIAELMPFEPGWVTVTKNPDYSISYVVQTPQGKKFDVPPENMWHLRGPSWCGYVGMDMVYQARNAIGLALATEEYGSGLFKNGARPGGLLISKTPLNKEKGDELKAAWKEANSGPGNAMGTALVSGDLDFKLLSQTAEEAQFIETRRSIVEEVCRFMRVLPIMVMQGDKTASYASVEQMFLAHLTHTLMPWYRRVEQSIAVNLLTEEDRKSGHYVKFMANGLMRGTAKERAEYNQILLQNGVQTVNEWREAEDMNRSDDPEAEKLKPAANLYGPSAPTE